MIENLKALTDEDGEYMMDDLEDKNPLSYFLEIGWTESSLHQ